MAVARKFLVQLWQYLKTGALPEGAETVSWRVQDDWPTAGASWGVASEVGLLRRSTVKLRAALV